MIAASGAEDPTRQGNYLDDLWQEVSEHQAAVTTRASQATPFQTNDGRGNSALQATSARGNSASEATSAGGQSRKQQRQRRRRAWSLLFRVGQGSPALE